VPPVTVADHAGFTPISSSTFVVLMSVPAGVQRVKPSSADRTGSARPPLAAVTLIADGDTRSQAYQEVD
jgi:hypothetical protein